MKTTEIFVEQVLIGFLVLLIPGLLWWDTLAPAWNTGTNKLFTGAALAGAAYLIGIAYDRVADTLLEDLDQHFRLAYALKPSGPARGGSQQEDPFPESKLRMALLHEGKAAAVDSAEYLRSRIRLTRALATLIPGMAVVTLLMLLRGRISPGLWLFGAVSIPVTYLGSWLAQSRGWRGYKPPKTYDANGVTTYRKLVDRLGTRANLWFALRVPTIWAWGLLTTIAILLGVAGHSLGFVGLAFAGALMTYVVGWCWWRITVTFFALIDNYSRFAPRAAA
jgi:hypothetical protein